MLSSQSEMFYKIAVLENFAKLTENHLCRSLFSKSLAGSRQYCGNDICENFESTFFMELLYFVTLSETIETILKRKVELKFISVLVLGANETGATL